MLFDIISYSSFLTSVFLEIAGWDGYRGRLYDWLEDPGESKSGKVFAVCAVCFIVVSILGLILGSIPELQDEKGEPMAVFEFAEYVCIAWFTSEYLLRLLAAPKKLAYIKAPMNIVDLLTILPFYLELAVSLAETEEGKEAGWGVSNLKGMLLVMRILRVLRVARLFKLARYSSGLQAFAITFQKSLGELGMLGLSLLTAIVFFSTIVYFLEKDEPGSQFVSIPAAAWWCVITMTTVGYGDIVPVTIGPTSSNLTDRTASRALPTAILALRAAHMSSYPETPLRASIAAGTARLAVRSVKLSNVGPGGKLVASVASISGVLVLAFPITMIVDNFASTYNKPGSTRSPTPRP